MRTNRIVLAMSVGGALFIGACGGGDGGMGPDDGNDGDNTGGSRMTATIDGQAWTASTGTGLISAVQFAPLTGGYIIFGTEAQATGQPGTALTFTINDIVGPGTYTLGVDGVSVIGGFAAVTTASGATWTTPLSGAAGTITITALTTAHITGTFEFTATAASGGASGARAVTKGVFDAPFANTVTLPAALPDSVGSRMTATLGGTGWNAAIVAAGTTATHFSLTGINAMQTLVLTIPKPATAGTYALSNQPGSILLAWDPSAVAPAGARCCWGVQSDVGSITFTTLTVTRAKGTFSATLSPQPGTAASGQLVITNGVFDVGLFHNP